VAARTLEAGVLVATSGEQTSLFVAPALTVSEEELDTLLAALDHGLELADQEAAKGVGSGAPA
jgi:4-aminobutyrate aminotransferase-like enzyme